MEEIQQHLRENLAANRGSFVYSLHEKSYIDLEEFEKFCCSAKTVNSAIREGKEVDALTVAMLYSVYLLLVQYIGCHFDPNDGFEIENLTPDMHDHIRNKLDEVFDLRWVLKN